MSKSVCKQRGERVFGVGSQFRCAAPEGRAADSGNLCSDPENARSRICFLIERACTLPSPDAALSPRRATHFLLLRQKKVSQEKATLVPASLRCAAGNLRCSVQPGSRANSLRSNKHEPYSVWTSAPRPIHKGWGPDSDSGRTEPASRA